MTMAEKGTLTIEGRPTKSFFVDWLTRDITLTDCILDLIDNSLQSEIAKDRTDVSKLLLEEGGPAAGLRTSVAVKLSKTEFEVKDTSAGITSNDARTYVFRFGATEGSSGSAGLGVYGIGMKRAMFKIGKDIKISSSTTEETFHVTIDAVKWKGDDTNWDFAFDSPGPSANPDPNATGTTLRINKLNDGVGDFFGQVGFIEDLRTRISSTYSLFLRAGVSISVNDVLVPCELPPIASSEEIRPSRYSEKNGPVDILVISGLSGAAAESQGGGWYIFCNGRMILGPDRSWRTGWGTDLPQFHPKYNDFVGYVYFRSVEPSSLPWTTTKEDIVFESSLYKRAYQEILVQSRPIISFLNKAYRGVPEESAEIRSIKGSAQSVTVLQVPKTNSSFTVPSQRPTPDDLMYILYQRKRADLDRVRRRLKKPKLSAKRIGEETFDYFIRKECQ